MMNKLKAASAVGDAINAARLLLADFEHFANTEVGREAAMIRTKLDEADLWLGRMLQVAMEGPHP